MTNDAFDSTCLRHPSTLSNLRCGRCNDLICPQCMVQSPVGARCPDCATIGRAPIFRATTVELVRTIGLSVGAAIVFGIAYGLIVRALAYVPINFDIANVLSSLLLGAAGAPIGKFVLRAGKFKLDARLRIVAAGTMFVVWAVGMFVATSLGMPAYLFTNIINYIGLGAGIYVAMNRVRP